MLRSYSRKRFICMVIVAVFGFITVFEPLSVAAMETENAAEQDDITIENSDKIDAVDLKSSGYAADDNTSEKYIPNVPEIKSWKRISQTAMHLTWDKPSGDMDGFEIQYSEDESFAEKASQSLLVENPDSTAIDVNNLKNNKKYYVRIRAYIIQSDQMYCSKWGDYHAPTSDKTSAAALLKRAGRTYELNESAGQKTGQHDVLQGSCTDGTYSYYVLYNKSNETCRILKSRASDNAAVKVSGVLSLNHGNDITYNSKTNRLVAVHYSKYQYRISVINPQTLTVEAVKDIKVPESLEGASSSQLLNIKGFSAIAYNSLRDQYVLRIRSSHNYLLVDASFSPVKYVAVSKYNSDLNQGIDADADYIYDVQSKAGSYNTVTVYDWDGEYQYKVKIPVNYEMESLYHSGDKFYAGVYHSYYQTYYTTHYKTYKVKWKKVKVKWKKVKGKWKYKKVWKYKTKYKYKTVKYKVKWKKVKGKWKYKTKKKKVKVTYQVAHKRLVRCNYVYNIGAM